MYLPWHLYLMASLYVLAGLNHFRVPKLYLKMIPPVFPSPKAINSISGLAEILLGVLLCLPIVSSYAACGIILLLIAIFPANIYMYIDKKAGLKIPKWLLLIRLPFQIVLIYWAYCYV